MARIHPLDRRMVDRIRRRRHDLGWSQNDLALAAGLTEGAVAKYETLRCPIPPDKRDAMERALAQAEGAAPVPA